MSFKFINGWKFPEFESRLCAVDDQGNSTYKGLNPVNEALKFVKKFDLFLDVGANVGLISVPLCSKFKKVVSVECVPETYECLKYNLEKFTNAVPLNFAVSDTNGSTRVAIPKQNGEMISSGWASISQDRQDAFEEKIFLEVETKTIDSLNLEALDFLKIDAEQAEMMVVKGAINTINRFKPVIEFENKRKENIHVFEFLKSIGYTLLPGRREKSSECIMHFSN